MDATPLDTPQPLEEFEHDHVGNHRWLPITAVQEGMVTARPVVGLAGVLETMFIAIGSTITANTIAQMVNKGVECVAVFDPPSADLADAARLRASFELRLQEIFGFEPDDACRTLMNALLQAQPTLC